MDTKKAITNALNKIKSSLKVGSKGIIGVDIGLSSVKVAQMTGSAEAGFTLVAYASEPLPEGTIIEDDIQKEDELKEAILKAIEKSGSSCSNVAISLSGPNTVARKLQLAGGSYEEIEDQVSWEVEQYIPFSVETSKVSFHIVGENEGGGVDVIVAAAKGETVDSYKALYESIDLIPKVIDLGVLAITNVFEVVYDEKLEDGSQSWILIDLGAQKTEFVIYKNHKIMFTKEIDIGGVMITEEIQRQMGVNYYEAEDLKCNGDENGNLPEEILEIIDDVVENFFSEIKKTIDFYISSTSDESFVECVLTGGSCLIPGLIEGLEALLGISVSIMNPFEAIDYDKKNIKEEQLNEIAYRGAAVLGLAMRLD
ncbi:type IV pilus assembly protein PilM [Halobacteriovorax sp. HLS]|uniref:type IV pilus assembly protein PilM n=1 Tax=Halobacteriovorax sp. HLS TaxID=2234000 RepID=UPI0013E3C2BC|nr:type IV pilus assembly protein PilM [Halobacteriovorax sp. HLS]